MDSRVVELPSWAEIVVASVVAKGPQAAVSVANEAWAEIVAD
jgi:hypothetical protein